MFAFQLSDLTTRRPVLFDERKQPRQPIHAGKRGDDRGVDLFEATEPTLNLAGGGELVADLDREFRDLVLDVIKRRRAHADQHATMLEHHFDLGDQRVIHLQGLDRPSVGSASNARAAATASTTSVLSKRRERRCAADR